MLTALQQHLRATSNADCSLTEFESPEVTPSGIRCRINAGTAWKATSETEALTNPVDKGTDTCYGAT